MEMPKTAEVQILYDDRDFKLWLDYVKDAVGAIKIAEERIIKLLSNPPTINLRMKSKDSPRDEPIEPVDDLRKEKE